MTTILYHNPKCTKCCITLQYLKKKNINFNIILYLNINLTKLNLIKIINSLNEPTKNIIRKNETIFKKLNLNLNNNISIIKTIIDYPILLQRPILIKNNKAIIGRPIKKIINFIDKNF